MKGRESYRSPGAFGGIGVLGSRNTARAVSTASPGKGMSIRSSAVTYGTQGVAGPTEARRKSTRVVAFAATRLWARLHGPMPTEPMYTGATLQPRVNVVESCFACSGAQVHPGGEYAVSGGACGGAPVSWQRSKSTSYPTCTAVRMSGPRFKTVYT